MDEVVFKPIGYVKVINEKEAELVLKPELRDALDGIDGFSHVFVIYFTHKLSGAKVPDKVHPKRDTKLPLIGVLSSRSPLRPNLIGLSVVKLIERKENILKVTGLDALDGTPILDIKPYIPERDSVPDATIPEFLKRAEGSNTDTFKK
ncbi:MAG: tRNA (N6-threonylcarbamoyladenosine(37)-N6)-methyltransferase TrmO [Candidatus Jordarchaeales archaeon]